MTRSPAHKPSGHEVVLVYADHAGVAGVRTRLDEAGFRVFATPSIERAIRRLAVIDAASAVLIDYAIPFDRSKELTNTLRLRPDFEALPIFYVAADCMGDFIAARIGLGAFYLKPVGLADLITSLKASRPALASH